MQRERDIVGFGHHRDLPRLGDAACMGDVGLDDVDGTGGDHLAGKRRGRTVAPSAIGVGVFPPESTGSSMKRVGRVQVP